VFLVRSKFFNGGFWLATSSGWHCNWCKLPLGAFLCLSSSMMELVNVTNRVQKSNFFEFFLNFYC
jgi:hypothetical protein